MNGITDFMSNDHDRLDSIFKEFQGKKSENPEDAKNLFLGFKSGLERHIVWEEEILFPIFEEKTQMEGGPTAVMRMEHVQIKELLRVILNQVQKRNLQTEQQETELLGILHSHNVKEESVLYPWIDRTLTLQEIEGTLRKIQNI